MAVMVDGSTIVLTGTVDDGGWFWDDGFSAPDVIRALAQIGHENDITVRINSGGGIATEGAAIHAALVRHGGRKTVVVEGIAASAASVIVMAGDERIMTPGSVMMIHDPANITLGTIVDHQQTIGQLEAIATSMAGVYATASGQTPEQARADMLAETWLTPEEAVSRGYATSITGAVANDDEGGAVDVVREGPAPEPSPFAYAQYRHPPERIAAMASANGWNRSRPRAAATAQSRQTETPMANDTTGGGKPAPNPNGDANPVTTDQARAEGYKAAVAYMAEVTDLCALAGTPEKARAFIDAAKPIADVRAELVTAKATASADQTINSQHTAPPSDKGPKPRMSAVDSMRKQLGLKGE